MSQPILSSIFFTTNEPTLTRQNKNFASFEKERIDTFKMQQQKKFEAKIDSIREKTFESNKSNIPVKIQNNELTYH